MPSRRRPRVLGDAYTWGVATACAPTATRYRRSRKRPGSVCETALAFPLYTNKNKKATRQDVTVTPAEVERLVKTARKRGRYGSRDGLAILMGFRHGLRVSELVGLCWSQIN